MMSRMLKLATVVMLILSLLVPMMATAEEECAGDPPLTVEVELRSNPSTGYTWKYEVDNEAAIEVVYNGFFTENEEMVGVPGVDDFTLSGLAEGPAVITFTYVGPGEDAVVAYTIIYTVWVTESGDVQLYNVSFDYNL